MKTSQKAGKSPESRAARIEGKTIHYLTAGQGPAVILLHGYTQTSRMWRPLIETLKKNSQSSRRTCPASATPIFQRAAAI